MPQPTPYIDTAPAWTVRQTAHLSLIVALAVGVALTAFALRYILLLVFIGIVLSTALKPLARWLGRRDQPGVLSTSIVYGVVVLGLAGAMAGLLPWLLGQLDQLRLSLVESYTAFRSSASPSTPVGTWMIAVMPETPPWPLAGSTKLETPSLFEAINFGGWIVQAFIGLGAVVLFAFYWTVNETRTVKTGLLLVSQERREGARDLVATLLDKVGAFVRGQGIVCAQVAVLSFCGFWLLGLPYAFPLAIAAGILEAVPFFGPTLASLPALAVAYMMGPQMAWWTLGLAVGVQGIENYVLVPRVMNHTVGVGPVTILLSLAAFGTLFGMLGAIVAIPLAAVLAVLVDRLLLQPKAPQISGHRDYSTLLQYQARELMQDIRLRLSPPSEAAVDPLPEHDRLLDEVEAIARDLDALLGDRRGKPQEETFQPTAQSAGTP